MTIREATAADVPGIARVHVESWRTTYAGIVPADHLTDLSVDDRERMWAARFRESAPLDPMFVAEDAEEGRIVGWARGGPSRIAGCSFRGELYGIYLLAAHQGQGIGRALVGCVAERLAAMGLHSLHVWCLADNPARGFYMRLGGRPFDRRSLTIGGAELEEIGYGWQSTEALRGGG